MLLNPVFLQPYLFVPALWVIGAVWLAAQYCQNNIAQWPYPNDILILTWVPFFQNKNFYFGKGEPEDFKAAGCEYTNCRIIGDRKLFPLDQYDAFLFHGFEYYTFLFGTPATKYPNQLYVYVSMESEIRTKIPGHRSNFYDLTMTYRLDSDIPWPYFAIIDRLTNKNIAPAVNPYWDDTQPPDKESLEIREIKELVAGKELEAAWIASNCYSYSGREEYVEKLLEYGIKVDAYGHCGTLTCVRNAKEDCRDTIGQKYYFYLVFENSLCYDYVTEKLVTALKGGAVPVILSGANITRFLPPGSYLDARELGPMKLAEEMRRLMKDPISYEKFLWWRTRYRVERRDPGWEWPKGKHPFCKLCAILQKPNDSDVISKRIEVRNWWRTRPDNDSPACLLPS